MDSLAMLLIFVIPLVLVLYISVKALSRTRLKLPPGPRGYPLIGNIFDIPNDVVWKSYHQLANRYNSPLVSLNILGATMIVIDTLQAAEDLIIKRSSIYASRPRMPMMNELVGLNWSFGNHPYGKEWRVKRKIFNRLFGAGGQTFWRPYATRASRRLLLNLLDTPADFQGHVRLLSGSLILAISYGIDVVSIKDPHIVRAEIGMYAVSQVLHGYLVDFIPSLLYWPAWMPGGHFKVKAAEWRKHVQDMVQMPFSWMKAKIASNEALPSLGLQELSCIDEGQAEQEKDLRDVLGVAYIAGSDTTVSALSSFVLAMMLHPEIQKKGQAAVDAILQQRRLPDPDDFGKIPYVDAILREVLRWNPVVPLGIPYSSLANDTYLGYEIPVGSTLFVNIWAMLHDVDTYGEDPMSFRPERFLLDNGELNPEVRYPEEAFGFGRRICPGQVLAIDSLWMSIASILATLQIDKEIGPDGKPLTPAGEFTPYLICHPKPFKCSIKPRFLEAASLIKTSQLDLSN